jgi:crossover junction endodeoxyribonuclease RuvC
VKLTIGFDPGKEGGYAYIGLPSGPLVGAFPFNGTELDMRRLWNTFEPVLSPYDDVLIVIEKVHAMPGQGVTSMFTFGSGFGELKAFAKILGRKWELVPPQTWKKHVLAGTDKSKGATIDWALRTYPTIQKELLKKSGLAHMGKVDALAIAHYGHHYHAR